MEMIIRFAAAACLVSSALAGPYAPAAGQPGSDAVAAADPRFTTWASSISLDRGPTEIGFPGSSLATYGDPGWGLGPADASAPDDPYPVVSLGDGGTATLEFAHPFSDIPGPDFAVFENSFTTGFLELAHVEVSSDGVNFFRFPSVSLNPANGAPGEGGDVNPTNVHNLAGKYIAGHGTPFDLAELRSASPLLDTQRVTHVRVVDVVGSSNPAFGTFDSIGNLVIDPYPTPFHSSGFDLDAVGGFAKTAATYADWCGARNITDPNPALDSDQDGVPNLIQYLTGNGRLAPTATSSAVTLTFNRLSYRADADLRIEASPDMAVWTPIAESVQGASMASLVPDVIVSESGAAAKQVTLTLLDGIYQFFRLTADR